MYKWSIFQILFHWLIVMIDLIGCARMCLAHANASTALDQSAHAFFL